MTELPKIVRTDSCAVTGVAFQGFSEIGNPGSLENTGSGKCGIQKTFIGHTPMKSIKFDPKFRF